MGSPFDEPISSADAPHIAAQPSGPAVAGPLSHAGDEPVHIPTREELQDMGLADVQDGIDALRASASLEPLIEALGRRVHQHEHEAGIR